MKLTDYVVYYLKTLGINHGFVVTGSAVADLIDAFTRVEGIEYVCVQHEQAGAMAADGYSRVSGNLGVAISTSGPGATNLVTGICSSWFDSIPCIYISGQINSRFTKGDKPVRQIGFQETDIVTMVSSVTKYAYMVKSADEIKYVLDKAVYEATSGRPGPVLIDLPMDIQRAEVNPDELKGFTPPIKDNAGQKTVVEKQVDEYLEKLKTAQRPVVLVGGGIRLAKTKDLLDRFLNKAKIPVVSTWPGMDVLEFDHPLYRGRIGTYGMRSANFTIQNSDLTLSLGTRHGGRQTGGRVDTFARGASRFIVDIDNGELTHQSVKCHVNINCDLKDFFDILLKKIAEQDIADFSSWIDKTKEWKDKYPICLPEYYQQKQQVNPYVFMKELSKQCQEGDIIIGDTGANLVVMAQAFENKKDQRVYSAWAHSPMGYALPSAMGACLADSKKRVIALNGDGGMQLNIQELQTIKTYNLPIKIFVMNNHSLGIIKQFQDIYLGSRYEASGRGYDHPDFVRVAEAYGLVTESISNHQELQQKIEKVLNYDGPIICDVDMPDNLELLPRLGWGTPIEDQYPYLPREEFNSNMFIEPLKNAEMEK